MKLHPGYHNLCNVNKAENPTHVKRTTASFTAQHAVNTHEKSWVMLVKWGRTDVVLFCCGWKEENDLFVLFSFFLIPPDSDGAHNTFYEVGWYYKNMFLQQMAWVSGENVPIHMRAHWLTHEKGTLNAAFILCTMNKLSIQTFYTSFQLEKAYTSWSEQQPSLCCALAFYSSAAKICLFNEYIDCSLRFGEDHLSKPLLSNGGHNALRYMLGLLSEDCAVNPQCWS